MIEEIKEDNNCIIKAFENNPISILQEDINNKKVYYFKASDVAKVLDISQIRSSIQNYDSDEKVVRKVNDLRGCEQDTTFLTSQGVYRLLYNSKKDIAKKFRKWVGNILDDIIFNNSTELQKQLREKEQLLIKQKEKENHLNTTIEKLQKEKSLEKHSILLREFGAIGPIIYILKVKTYESGEYIIKIGESRRGILQRWNEHRTKYEEAVLLDCFKVLRSRDFEIFLHNHKNIKQNKVKDLLHHENENELFLVGKTLSYSTLLNIIEQNIKHFNDSYVEVEKLQLENEQLRQIEKIYNNPESDCFKELLKSNKDLNEKLNTRLENIEKMLNELKLQMNPIKTVTNFNEPLKTLGPRLQKINPETLQLVKVYESVTECMKENQNIKRPSINKAIMENTVYQGFRWLLVDRELDPTMIHSIKPTKVTKIQNIGYIAKLNKDKNQILNVYLDRKTAAHLNGINSIYTMEMAVKCSNILNGYYYILYNDCDENVKNTFIKPILYKDGIGKFDCNNNLIKEFICKYECSVNENINIMYNNHYYKHIGTKLQCTETHIN